MIDRCPHCGTHPAFLTVDCTRPDLAPLVSLMQDPAAGETTVAKTLEDAHRAGRLSLLDSVGWGLFLLSERNRARG